MHGPFTDDELLAYLDEMLPVDRAAELEQSLRDSSSLRERVSLLIRMRDQGGHTLGEIWRRNRLSCPTRSQLGGYLLGTLTPEMEEYITFHLETIGCRVCSANLEDLQEAQAGRPEALRRCRKYFESSAGTFPRATPTPEGGGE